MSLISLFYLLWNLLVHLELLEAGIGHLGHSLPPTHTLALN